MSWLTKLIAPSPFSPLVELQAKISEGIERVPLLVDAVIAGNQAEVLKYAKELSKIENEADVMKTRLRDSLPRSVFMQVSRPVLLDVLSLQDSVADAFEDLGVLFSMRTMECPPKEVCELLKELVDSVVQVCNRASEVVNELPNLSGASFSGPEAQRVLTLIDLVDREEHLSDKIQDKLAKAFFRHEDSFKPAAIFLWMKIFNKIGDLANFSEKLTHRIRLFMAD